MKIAGLQQHAFKPHMLHFNYFLMIIAIDRADHQRVIVVFLTEVKRQEARSLCLLVKCRTLAETWQHLLLYLKI